MPNSIKRIRKHAFTDLVNIEKEAYPNNMMLHQHSSQSDFEDSNICLGEDWYLIYEETSDNSIYISDLAKTIPDLEDECSNQDNEIMNTIYNLVRTYDQVSADLKEDTSYLLF